MSSSWIRFRKAFLKAKVAIHDKKSGSLQTIDPRREQSPILLPAQLPACIAPGLGCLCQWNRQVVLQLCADTSPTTMGSCHPKKCPNSNLKNPTGSRFSMIFWFLRSSHKKSAMTTWHLPRFPRRLESCSAARRYQCTAISGSAATPRPWLCSNPQSIQIAKSMCSAKHVPRHAVEYFYNICIYIYIYTHTG